MARRLLLILLLLLLIFAPAAAWMLFKPVRVMAPQLVTGITCVTETVCIEELARYDEAERLYGDAASSIESTVAVFENRPRTVFCSTQACFESFGFSKSSAHAVGVAGIVIGPQGWAPHYLRHEMIHHLQAERLGVYKQWRSPDWFIEGMAYSLSEDPRQNLAAPWQQYRARFEEWYRRVDKERLWREAENL